jgi:hypothetical protein
MFFKIVLFITNPKFPTLKMSVGSILDAEKQMAFKFPSKTCLSTLKMDPVTVSEMVITNLCCGRGTYKITSCFIFHASKTFCYLLCGRFFLNLHFFTEGADLFTNITATHRSSSLVRKYIKYP